MRVIYRKIRLARYLYIKRNVEKVWGARYTLGASYLSKNTVLYSLLQRSAATFSSPSSLHIARGPSREPQEPFPHTHHLSPYDTHTFPSLQCLNPVSW